MKKGIAALLALLLALVLTACGTAPAGPDASPAATPTQKPSGSVAGMTFTVKNVTRMDLTEGAQLALVECDVINNTDTEQFFSSLKNFRAVDTEGNTLVCDIEALREAAAQKPDIVTLDGKADPGGTVSGALYFKTEKGVLIDSVTFEPLLNAESVTVRLGGK